MSQPSELSGVCDRAFVSRSSDGLNLHSLVYFSEVSIIIRSIVFVGIIVIAASGWWYIQQQSSLSIDDITTTLQQTREIIAPPPLRGPRGFVTTTLTRAGVFAETNSQRATNDLPALTASPTLDRAAQAKLEDMLTQQYFEHIGPDNKGPADWVEGVGYHYLRVGENLALGNFGSDTLLVQAWMDSPGHRANILHTGFSEIGIAVGRGNFEGQSTWLAVQTFALPQNACPTPDAKLASDIEATKKTMASRGDTLDQERVRIDEQSQALEGRLKEIESLFTQAQQKIQEGNAEIAEGNRIYQESGSQEQAQPHWDEGKRLQAEGEELLEQARQQQTAYNEAVENLRQQQVAFNNQLAVINDNHSRIRQMIAAYNQQVKKFNDCAK